MKDTTEIHDENKSARVRVVTDSNTVTLGLRVI